MGLCLPRGGQEIPTAASSCTPNTSGQPATVYTPLHEHKTHHCAKYAAFYAGPGAGNPNVPSALLMPACSVSAFQHKATRCRAPGEDTSPLGHCPVPWHSLGCSSLGTSAQTLSEGREVFDRGHC